MEGVTGREGREEALDRAEQKEVAGNSFCSLADRTQVRWLGGAVEVRGRGYTWQPVCLSE